MKYLDERRHFEAPICHTPQQCCPSLHSMLMSVFLQLSCLHICSRGSEKARLRGGPKLARYQVQVPCEAGTRASSSKATFGCHVHLPQVQVCHPAGVEAIPQLLQRFRTLHQDWCGCLRYTRDALLCPVSHGMPPRRTCPLEWHDAASAEGKGHWLRIWVA